MTISITIDYYGPIITNNGIMTLQHRATTKAVTLTDNSTTGTDSIKNYFSDWVLPENKFFTSWNTSSDGSGTTYMPDDIIEFTSSTTITLYAQLMTLKLVNVDQLESALKATAEAIKTIKGDPSSSITFNNTTGFASAIESIEVEGVDVSNTTAIASDVLSGKYFFNASGIRTEGTLSDANLIAGNIKDGVTILGTTGTYKSNFAYTDTQTITQTYPTSDTTIYSPNTVLGQDAATLGTYTFNINTYAVVDISITPLFGQYQNYTNFYTLSVNGDIATITTKATSNNNETSITVPANSVTTTIKLKTLGVQV